MKGLLTLIATGMMLNMSAHAGAGKDAPSPRYSEARTKNAQFEKHPNGFKKQRMEEDNLSPSQEKSKAMALEKDPNILRPQRSRSPE